MSVKLPSKVFDMGRWWYLTTFEYEIDGSKFTGFFYSTCRLDAACRLEAIKENAVLGNENVEFIG